MKFIKNILINAICLAGIVSCGANDENIIVVGASASPHAEILEVIKPLLEDKGYKLKIETFSDYITPNTALEDGDIDANYFQHITYLNNFNTEYSTHLVSVGGIHYEPFGIYPGSKNNLNEISKGDTILIPNDATNEARALLLLEQAGLIEVDNEAGIYATKYDITNNPYNLNIVEMNAELIAGIRDDGAFAIINGNYALSAGLNVSDAIIFESSEGLAAQAYVNVLATKDENQNTPKILALYEALTSEIVKSYIKTKYNGSVVALF